MGVAAGCPELFRVGVVALASLVEASALAGFGGWSWLVLPVLFCLCVWVGWWGVEGRGWLFRGWLKSTLLGF